MPRCARVVLAAVLERTVLISGAETAREQRATELEAELGYGLGAPQGWGVVTPYTGVTLADGGQRTLRGGVRWNASHSATFALEAERQEQGEDTTPSDAVMLRAQVRF